MGIAPFQINKGHKPLPSFTKNDRMANFVYLIKHNPSQGKKSHMSIIIDIAGESTEEEIIGLILHVIVDRPALRLPLATKCDYSQFGVKKNKVEYRIIGSLESSQYRTNIENLPNALKNALLCAYSLETASDVVQNIFLSNFFMKLCSNSQPPNLRTTMFLMPLSKIVFHEMVRKNSNDNIWSSTINCQTYAKYLIEFGLGLEWPTDVVTSNDIPPEIVDFGLFYQSLVATSNDKYGNDN